MTTHRSRVILSTDIFSNLIKLYPPKNIYNHHRIFDTIVALLNMREPANIIIAAKLNHVDNNQDHYSATQIQDTLPQGSNPTATYGRKVSIPCDLRAGRIG